MDDGYKAMGTLHSVWKLTVSEGGRLRALPLLPDPSDVLFQPAPWLDLKREGLSAKETKG